MGKGSQAQAKGFILAQSTMKSTVSMQRTALTASSRTAGSVRASARSGVRRSHVLRAQERDSSQGHSNNEFMARGAKTLAAIALAATISMADVPEAQAKKDISGLTPCAKSKPYAKRQKQAVKALEKRLKKYEAGSAGEAAIKDTIKKTKNRFKMYGDTGVLCGKDGYPHLIADPGFALQYGHTGEILVPTFGFVYVAGLIGYAGRQYLLSLKGDKKPTEGEIIIDVPKALDIMVQSVAWPIKTYTELRNGSLTAAKEDITVSPR